MLNMKRTIVFFEYFAIVARKFDYLCNSGSDCIS